MTLPNSDDGNQEQPMGGTELPASSPSGSQQGQQLPEYVSALVKRQDELEKQIRGQQKGTDKRFEQVSGSIKRILELKEQGLDETQIQRELWIDQQIQGHDTPSPQPVGNESGRQAPDVESAFKTVEEYGLSQNDPDFLALIRKSTTMKPGEFDAKVKDYVLGKVRPPKPANPADIVQSPVTAGATSKSIEALASDYKTKMLAAPRGRAGDAQRAAIKAEYERQGVPTHSIDFTS